MKESYRDQRGLPFLETLIRDSRLALRRLRMAPAFTVATLLTLALGIGATTSIFTLVHAVLLKSLPVAKPGELYRVGKEAKCCYLAGYSQEKEFSLVSYDLYKYLRDNTKGFVELAAFPAADMLFRRPARGQFRGGPDLRRRIRFRQLLRHVRNWRVCRAHPYCRGRSGRRAAGRRNELSLVAGKIWVGSVGNRQHSSMSTTSPLPWWESLRRVSSATPCAALRPISFFR